MPCSWRCRGLNKETGRMHLKEKLAHCKPSIYSTCYGLCHLIGSQRQRKQIWWHTRWDALIHPCSQCPRRASLKDNLATSFFKNTHPLKITPKKCPPLLTIRSWAFMLQTCCTWQQCGGSLNRSPREHWDQGRFQLDLVNCKTSGSN